METLNVRTSSRTDFKDITREIASAISKTGVIEGACMVYIPHTTAGVTINENADPAVMHDMETILDRLIPWTGSYRHSEGNSAAHAKSTLVGQSVLIPVQGGRLVLGTWQGIYFCEFDGPRTRRVHISSLQGH
ncbi:MAG: YjbQ family protein [Actinobacteria bacterium]|nr:YjbQ family protein [Actinomycetota bacterium]